MVYDTVLEWFLFVMVNFLAGILKSVFNIFFILVLIYVVFYCVCRYLVCQNDKDEFDEVWECIRSGIKDGARAFCVAMRAVYESAKCWAADKIEKRHRRF